MHVAIEGLLIGAGIGLFLVAMEYVLIRKAVIERAERYKRKAEFDVTERGRVISMARFAVFLPPAFALAFWIIWG